MLDVSGICIFKYYISLYVMLALYPRMRIKAFSKDNKATVFGIADILKLYYDNTYNEKLEKAIEGIILFSFANPNEAERTSKQMIDSLYDLLHECYPHFKRMTIGEFKTIVIRQTRSWIKNNRLKDGFSRSPDIYEQCFIFCLYNYINALRRQETIKDHDDLKDDKNPFIEDGIMRQHKT